MINLFNTHVENLSIHKVGNKNKAEEIFLSENPYSLNDEIMPILKEYFFKAFHLMVILDFDNFAVNL